MENNFDAAAFTAYLAASFPAFRSGLALELAENVTEYARKNHNVSRDQLVWFLLDVFPDVLEFGEIAQYADDSILTQRGQEEKRAYIQEHGKQ